jgi:hypothetical protein
MKLSVTKLTVALLFAVTFFATCVFAGPPLLCHTFDIGEAQSLPWIGHTWNLTGNENYNTNNLPADTIAILDHDSTVLVHMETLRRAALYGQKNPQALKQFLARLVGRSEASGKNEAMASFDLGYFVATLNQIQLVYKDFANPVRTLDANALIKKAIQLRGKDPQMEFAAALITLDGPTDEHNAHAKLALAGAPSDPVLLRNLDGHFMGTQSETMSQMITRKANGKVTQQ